MDVKKLIKNTQVIILCGGLGTRLKPLFPDKQKVLTEFRNKAFLDILIADVKKYGFKKFILCVGHLKNQVIKHSSSYSDIDISFSEEGEPLGTGGALKNALSFIESNPFLVLNGDSLCKVNYYDLFKFHLKKASSFTCVLSNLNERKDGGNVQISNDNKITQFNEKSNLNKSSFINSGIYLMNNSIFKHMPYKNRFSLEYDLFPKLIGQSSYGFLTPEDVIDIGTVERYKSAQEIL